MKNILTLDIGGTAIKSAIYRSDGTLIADLPTTRTLVSDSDNQILKQVLEMIARVQTETAEMAEKTENAKIDGVAIASAGVIDPENGAVVYAGPTIPNYTGTALKSTIEAQTGLRCEVENDVNAAALGEFWRGSGQGSRSMLCLTIGTGVGGAVLLDGKLWHGHQFTAGEVGYLPIFNGKNLQECASTLALLGEYENRSGEAVNGEGFFMALQSQDNHAIAAFEHFSEALISGLLPAIYLLAPQTIIIGGGITAQRAILEPKINELLQKHIQAPRFLPEKVTCATLGNRAGMLGALYHFCQKS